MPDRPHKLPPLAVTVVWCAKRLTLAEKVVWYRDWSLDTESWEACYAAPIGLSKYLGGSVKPGSVSTIRQRLKRLGLHYPIDRSRADGEHLGWVATLPAHCIPRSGKDAWSCAVALDQHVAEHDAGLRVVGGIDIQDPQNADVGPLEPAFQAPQKLGSRPAAGGATGGLGGISSRLSGDQPVTSEVTEPEKQKRQGANAPEQREEKRDPAVVRAEQMALIRLQKGQPLTPEQKVLVRGWLDRQPTERQDRLVAVRRVVGT